MNKFWLTIGGLILLLIIIIVSRPDGDQLKDNTADLQTLSKWVDYQSPELAGDYRFSIKHPRSIDPEQDNDNAISLKYTGSQNQDIKIDNMAMIDGFEVEVQVQPYQDLVSFTDQAINTVKETTFDGRVAHRFGTKDPVNNRPVNNLLIVLDDNYLAEVTYSAVTLENIERRVLYFDTIDSMLDTLQFTNSTTGDDVSNDDNPSSKTTDSVFLALLTDPSGTPDRGCDNVKMVKRNIEPTTAPLTSAMKLLFSTSDTTINGARHFIPNTADTLKFERATVSNNTANIYLTGKLSGLAGVCDNPRAAIQIEETAKQFSTVDNVQIYLNGEKTTLIPSER